MGRSRCHHTFVSLAGDLFGPVTGATPAGVYLPLGALPRSSELVRAVVSRRRSSSSPYPRTVASVIPVTQVVWDSVVARRLAQ